MPSTVKRSVLKTLTWRLVASLIIFTIAIIYTGSLAISGLFGLCEFVGKGILYFIHERIWQCIKWGDE